MKYFIFYLLVVNVFSFVEMYNDKYRARKRKQRISENRLFILAAAFGSIGILTGMYYFRHKTKHMKFVFGIPSILLVQIFVLYKLFFV